MIAIIPARSGSKTIPDKNIRPLTGKPLIVWSIETAKECGLEPWVSSDSEEYLDIARKHGAKTLLRPAHLAQDSTTTYEVLLHEIERIEPQPKEIALFQPTSPFRKPENVLKAIEIFRSGGFDSLISVIRIPDRWHPDEALQVKDGQVLMASGVQVKARKTRRQDYGTYYVPSGSLYLLKTENLQKGSIYGDKTGLFEEEETVNINDWNDWEKAEELGKSWAT